MRFCHTSLLITLLATASIPARAAGGGKIRLVLEPGVGTLLPPYEEALLGWLGGASFAVSLSQQLWIQLHVDYKLFNDRSPSLTSTAYGATLAYNLDILWVTPSIEIGLARVSVEPERGATPEPEIVPVMGLAVDTMIFSWLLAGIEVRYYPLFESGLLEGPAFTTIHARIGVVLRLGDGD